MGESFGVRGARIGASLLITLGLASCGGGGSSEGAPTPTQNGSISGRITAIADSFTDSDSNDPTRALIRNDLSSTAQVIGNPATVGGYVTQAGQGAEGPLRAGGDSSDIYRIRLAAGQALALSIGDFENGDLDLFLSDAGGTTLVDASEGVGRQEAVIAPRDGEYLVEVFAFEGHSNYTLQSLSGGAALGIDSFRYATAFQPGELIVSLQPGARAKSATLTAAARTLGATVVAGEAQTEQLVQIDTAADAIESRSTRARAHLRPAQQDARLRTLAAAKRMARDPQVASVSLNGVHRALAAPDDELFARQWHYTLINLPAALDVTRGENTLVAVIDTGVLLTHPDLIGQFDASDPDGADFIRDLRSAGDGSGVDDNALDIGDRLTPGGLSSFHGSHVAGTVAAASNNGRGVAGVAGGARIMPLRVLGVGGSGTSYDILQAVRYAAGLPNDLGRVPARRADVINLSLGGGPFSSAEQSVYQQARANGVIIVAAAGNDGDGTLSYPASYAGVVSVAAVSPGRRRAPYSQFNAEVDVAAPGGDQSLRSSDGVLSTSADDSSGSARFVYQYQQGTSMAAPHVAGVVALMKAVHPGLTPQAFDTALASGALTQDLGTPGRDVEFGHGLIDAARAVAHARQLAGAAVVVQPARPTVAPLQLEFGAGQASIDFTLGNAGGGSFTVQDTRVSSPWLSVRALGDLAYRATIDRSGLPEGLYTAEIELRTTAGDLRLPVRMEVRQNSAGANAGTLYVLAFDPQTFEAVQQVAVTPSGGVYPFALTDLPAGRYLVGAGTDLNNDGFICDAGEACGGYDALDMLREIELGAGGAVTGIDFVAGYAPTTAASAASTPTAPIGPRRRPR